MSKVCERTETTKPRNSSKTAQEKMKSLIAIPAVVILLSHTSYAFAPPLPAARTASQVLFTVIEHDTDTIVTSNNDALTKKRELERHRQKQALLGLLGGMNNDQLLYDPVLADPLTKDALAISLKGPILGGRTPSSSGVRLALRSSMDSNRVFEGRTDAYINLLEPVNNDKGTAKDDEEMADSKSKTSVSNSPILSSLLTFTPPPLRSLFANGNTDMEYIPMRDLFTSPSVSFAYERGWRQGFSAAGFPGADKEFEMARDYFSPVTDKRKSDGRGSVVVDMSCATGLFTRRFAKSNTYSRVIGCDYSDSMLNEARRRIRADSELTATTTTYNNSNGASKTRLDLVRCDVASIPFQSSSIDALHAGAAMHCWPEMEPSLKEIHRVLVPGGRYFATTFLGDYFQTVAGLENTANGGEVELSMQAFQYFPSVDYLRNLMLEAGFEAEKVDVEAVGRACVIIRCEK